MSFDVDDAVSPYIVGIGSRVTSEDIDTYDRLERVTSRSESHRAERNLRQIYALVWLTLLSVEIVTVLVLAFLIGFSVVEIDKWIATAFIGGTFGQVSSMAIVVIRYLFPLQKGGGQIDKP